MVFFHSYVSLPEGTGSEVFPAIGAHLDLMNEPKQMKKYPKKIPILRIYLGSNIPIIFSKSKY
jgi:hypothetical protein